MDDTPTAAMNVRFWVIANKSGFWLVMVCQLMTQSGHRVFLTYRAATPLIPILTEWAVSDENFRIRHLSRSAFFIVGHFHYPYVGSEILY